MDKKKIDLFTKFDNQDLQLENRVVMSSLTRGRTTDPALTPTSLHEVYYGQRASAGLIITESAWVSKDAIGFINIPGIYNSAQVSAWKKVTDAVHRKGGKIFIQLVHSGAVSHRDHLGGKLPKGPSAVNPEEQSFTPSGFKATEIPEALSLEDITEIISSFRTAAENTVKAGFDGAELHAQLFTLIPQFLSRATNQRGDSYGGDISNRSRILFEILDALIEVIGHNKVGIKFTPTAFNPGIIRPDVETLSDYIYILDKLNSYPLAYIHIVGPAVDLSSTPLAAIKEDYFGFFRKHYLGTIIANLGFDRDSANDIISAGKADLVSFGNLYIANPDLVERFKNNWPLANADTETFYTGGEKGYIDYKKYMEK